MRSQVPWIVRSAEKRVVGLEIVEEQRHIRMPDDHGAGSPESLYRSRVCYRNALRESWVSTGRAHTGDGDSVFHGHRHTMEWSNWRATC